MQGAASVITYKLQSRRETARERRLHRFKERRRAVADRRERNLLCCEPRFATLCGGAVSGKISQPIVDPQRFRGAAIKRRRLISGATRYCLAGEAIEIDPKTSGQPAALCRGGIVRETGYITEGHWSLVSSSSIAEAVRMTCAFAA
ncbi:MAG: hypothetical protein AAF698_00030 [Pseudomonadota bacterium]